MPATGFMVVHVMDMVSASGYLRLVRGRGVKRDNLTMIANL